MRFLDVLRAETVKALTLRSLRWTLLVAVGLAALYVLVDSPSVDSDHPMAIPIPPEAAGVYVMANLVFFPPIISVLVVASEYLGGQLMTTNLAMPARGKVLSAKLVVSGVFNLVVALAVAGMVAFFYQHHLEASSVFITGKAGQLLTTLGLAVAYWVLLGVFSCSVAHLVRSQTVVMAGLVVLSFFAVPLMMAAPVFQYLPTNAGLLMFIGPDQTAEWLNPPSLSRSAATVVTSAWTVVALVVAVVVSLRRDVGTARVAVQ